MAPGIRYDVFFWCNLHSMKGVPSSRLMMKSLRRQEHMVLITITDWKRKAVVVLKLLLFLLLIGLIIPQFFTFIAGGLADIDNGKPHYMRVEKGNSERPVKDITLLERLQQFYYGKEPGSTR